MPGMVSTSVVGTATTAVFGITSPVPDGALITNLSLVVAGNTAGFSTAGVGICSSGVPSVEAWNASSPLMERGGNLIGTRAGLQFATAANGTAGINIPVFRFVGSGQRRLILAFLGAVGLATWGVSLTVAFLTAAEAVFVYGGGTGLRSVVGGGGGGGGAGGGGIPSGGGVPGVGGLPGGGRRR